MHLKHHSNESLQVRWLTVSGLSVRTAMKHGPGGRRPLMVVNGIGGSFELLRPFVDAVEDRDVILFDVPGAGKSAAPLLPWRMSNYAQVMVQILDQLGIESANILGLSWGGALAQQAARQYPDRFARLVLAATSPGHLFMLTRAQEVAAEMGRFLDAAA